MERGKGKGMGACMSLLQQREGVRAQTRTLGLPHADCDFDSRFTVTATATTKPTALCPPRLHIPIVLQIRPRWMFPASWPSFTTSEQKTHASSMWKQIVRR